MEKLMCLQWIQRIVQGKGQWRVTVSMHQNVSLSINFFLFPGENALGSRYSGEDQVVPTVTPPLSTFLNLDSYSMYPSGGQPSKAGGSIGTCIDAHAPNNKQQ